LGLAEFKDKYSGRIFLCGNGPSMGLLTDDQKERLNEEYLFVGSRFIDWVDSGLKPSFYILTERKQSGTWLDDGTWRKASVKIAKFWVNWQPAPRGWVSIEHPPSNAHDVKNYGTGCLMGTCVDIGVGIHLSHGKDTPLAMAQVARYMGFNEMYLLGCETTNLGKVYAPNMGRNMHAAGIMLPYYERAGHELPLRDCTFGGSLAKERGGPLEYVELEEALA
jgi:hypothetical protein